MLLLIAVKFVARSAQCHDVFDVIAVFTPSHAPGGDVVQVLAFFATNFAWDKIVFVIPEILEICLLIWFHFLFLLCIIDMPFLG